MRLILCLTVLLATAAGAAAAVVRHHQAAPSARLELLARVGKTVTITGPALTGLYPGAANTLVVTVRNLNAFTIRVAPVKGTVAAKTTAAGCAGPPNLAVKASAKTLRIAKGKSAAAALTVTMAPDAADACQGARFMVQLSAKAVKG